MSNYEVSESQRITFYEFIDRQYRNLEAKISKNTWDIEKLKRGVGLNLHSPFLTQSFETLIKRNYLVYPGQSRSGLVISKVIKDKIYSPLSLSSAILSFLLLIISVVLKENFLGISFGLSLVFSLYYYMTIS